MTRKHTDTDTDTVPDSGTGSDSGTDSDTGSDTDTDSDSDTGSDTDTGFGADSSVATAGLVVLCFLAVSVTPSLLGAALQASFGAALPLTNPTKELSLAECELSVS